MHCDYIHVIMAVAFLMVIAMISQIVLRPPVTKVDIRSAVANRLRRYSAR